MRPVADNSKFYRGAVLFVGFIAVLVGLFLPITDGKNSLDYLDDLYNSISKGSAYYIPTLRDEAGAFMGTEVSVAIAMENARQANQTAPIFAMAGAQVVMKGAVLDVTGNLGSILVNCLADADTMFQNQGEKLRAKYNCPERRALYNLWTALNAMARDLDRQKKFAEAAMVSSVVKKAVECSYNYYGIEPQNIADRVGIVAVSLLFYLVYTVWYGFAILFMFEGWGLRLEH